MRTGLAIVLSIGYFRDMGIYLDMGTPNIEGLAVAVFMVIVVAVAAKVMAICASLLT